MQRGGVLPALFQLLNSYADALTPWAQATAWRMLLDVNDRSMVTWRTPSEQISFGLKQELQHTYVGGRMQRLLADQVHLIRSIPLEAAERVQRLTFVARQSGARASEIAQEIARSGEVAKSRAVLIARTEVSKAATALVRARAEAIDSTHYVWETSRDGDVRPSHRAMQGKVVAWNEPPTLDRMTGHAGEFPNCRCWPRPILQLE